MSARSSPPKMKMWDQEELLRCCVGQRKHKSDFGETNPIFPQAQETKTHLSAMIYFRNEANFYFRTVCDVQSRSLITICAHPVPLIISTRARSSAWSRTHVHELLFRAERQDPAFQRSAIAGPATAAVWDRRAARTTVLMQLS